MDSDTSSGSSSGAGPANRLDSGYGTLRHPTMINTTPKGLPYTNLENASVSSDGTASTGRRRSTPKNSTRGTFPSSGFFPQEVGYLEPSKLSSVNTSAYLNPAYDSHDIEEAQGHKGSYDL